MIDANDPNSEQDVVKGDARNWVLRITSGHATRADVTELKQWCEQSSLHAEAFARASNRWRLMGPALESIAQSRGPAVAIQGRPAFGRRAFIGGAFAASAVGATAAMLISPPIGLWPSFAELAADYRTAPGERREVAVASNTSVEMNTRTSLNIRSIAGEKERIELIAGEASVSTRSRMIEVQAGDGRTVINAARVNVRCDGSIVRVTCLDGIAEVRQQRRSVTVRPNQQVAYSANGFESMATVDAAVISGWRSGDLYFRDEPLSAVIEEINRYRSGRIIVLNDALGQRRFTARFKLDRLDVIVAQLRAVFEASVTSLPGGIIILS